MEVWLFLEDSCCMTHRKSSERLRRILFMLRSLLTPSMRKWTVSFYKITKIVRALWLAERSVCMRVCKRGSGVKMFCFSRANHTSTNLKKFSSSKLDKFTLFTHSFVGWNLENGYKEGVSIFLAYADILSKKSPYFGKHLFAKQKLITRARLRGQDFATGKNFSFNQRKLFYKSNRKLFSCVCIAWYKHSRRWENLRQLCKPSTSSRVCITVSNSPNPSRVYIRLCKQGKRFLLLN